MTSCLPAAGHLDCCRPDGHANSLSQTTGCGLANQSGGSLQTDLQNLTAQNSLDSVRWAFSTIAWAAAVCKSARDLSSVHKRTCLADINNRSRAYLQHLRHGQTNICAQSRIGQKLHNMPMSAYQLESSGIREPSRWACLEQVIPGEKLT